MQAAQTVAFQTGIDGYSGTLEAGLDKNRPSTAISGRTLWIERLQASGKTAERQALLCFHDIIGGKPGQIPPGAFVSKAILRLYVGSQNETSSHRVYFNRMLVAWDKNAAWNSPAWGGNGVKADDRTALREPDANIVFCHPDQYHDIDVTSSVQAWARGEPNHGWVLRDVRTQSAPAGFRSSRESTVEKRPALTVTFATAPPPKAEPGPVTITRTDSGALAARLRVRATAGNATSAATTENTSLNVVFHGRKQATASPDFTLILLPDTQYYTIERHGGSATMFTTQIDWIVSNAKKLGIACVLHLGDITDKGDAVEDEWRRASIGALYRLEDPATTGLPDGIPYCLAVGNHDQRKPNGDWNGPTLFYEKYFGISHFKGKSYHGGSYEPNNRNYFVLFNAGTEKFIAVSLEYGRPRRDPALLDWTRKVLDTFSDRRAIIITHYAMDPGLQARFGPDGEAIYEALRGKKNLMLIAGGHVTGEGRRTDVFNGSTTHTLIQDFQFDEKGGNGFLRILTISPRKNQIQVQTYSPVINKWKTDLASDYTLDYDFGTKIEPYAEIGRTVTHSGSDATCLWPSLEPGSAYEWYAEVSDTSQSTRTDARAFRLSTAPAKPSVSP